MKCASFAVALSSTLVLATPASGDDARALFAWKCASCHGPDGKAQTAMGRRLGAPDLTRLKASEASITKAIETGKPPKMLAYKGKLTDEQIKALASYVKGGLK